MITTVIHIAIATKRCMCPCFKGSGLTAEFVKCSYSRGTPNSLMDHLKTKGGCAMMNLEEGPLTCPYHYAARMFLTKLYKGYYDGVDHEALYPVGTENWKRARNAAEARSDTRRNNKE